MSNSIEKTLTVAAIKQNIADRESMQERAKLVFEYWHSIVGKRRQSPDIDEIHFGYVAVTVQTREYIGCGDYDYFEFHIPLEFIVAENYKALIDYHANELKAQEELQERLHKEEQDRGERLAQEARVQKELVELARLEALYRGNTKKEV